MNDESMIVKTTTTYFPKCFIYDTRTGKCLVEDGKRCLNKECKYKEEVLE